MHMCKLHFGRRNFKKLWEMHTGRYTVNMITVGLWTRLSCDTLTAVFVMTVVKLLHVGYMWPRRNLNIFFTFSTLIVGESLQTVVDFNMVKCFKWTLPEGIIKWGKVSNTLIWNVWGMCWRLWMILLLSTFSTLDIQPWNDLNVTGLIQTTFWKRNVLGKYTIYLVIYFS